MLKNYDEETQQIWKMCKVFKDLADRKEHNKQDKALKRQYVEFLHRTKQE